jgi:hypothetical protein
VNGGAIIGMFCATLMFVRGIGVYRLCKPVVMAMRGELALDNYADPTSASC